MKKTFRDQFLRELKSSGMTLSEVARKSGVSYEQLKKFAGRENAKTNVDDAKALAAALGLSLNEIFGEPVQDQVRLASEWLDLPPELRAQALAYAHGVMASSEDQES